MFIFLFVDSFFWAVPPQAELLSKKYEEKYKQVGDVASKLTIEEATFRDIQVTVMFGFPLLYINVLAIVWFSFLSDARWYYFDHSVCRRKKWNCIEQLLKWTKRMRMVLRYVPPPINLVDSWEFQSEKGSVSTRIELIKSNQILRY